jgi:hypothetical protein
MIRHVIGASNLLRQFPFCELSLCHQNTVIVSSITLCESNREYARPMERLEKFTATNDLDGDIHLVRSTSPNSTLCGLIPASASTRDVTCYRCHQFEIGDI